MKNFSKIGGWLTFILFTSAMISCSVGGNVNGHSGDNPPADDDVADDDTVDDDIADDDSADDDTDDGAWLSPGCSGVPGAGGSFQGSMVSAGYERTYILDVPASYSGLPVALVVNLHGTGATAAEQKALSRFSEKGEEEGFIAVYPESLEYESDAKVKSWFIGNCDNRDVTFIADLLDRIESDYCIDKRQVHVTGISNGAYFTHILGAVFGSEIASIGPVAGGLGPVGKLCDPVRQMPAVIIHGDADDVVPVEKGREARDFWVAFNKCSTSIPDSNGCILYTDCTDDAEVLYCEIVGGVHWWPHGDFEATDVIWSFFEEHTISAD